jgi:hypothetical protein
MTERRSQLNPVVLIEAEPGRLNDVARRVRLQGAEPIQACGCAEAANLLPPPDLGTTAVLIDIALASRSLKKDLARLRLAAAGPDLFSLAVGAPPTSRVRKQLRSAGLQFALWEPFDDATLRFQLNRAWNADQDDHKRAHPRIPTYLHARIGSGARVKDGVVYSLSHEGAFLETPRATMAGAVVDLAIQLPTCLIETQAQVIFANVPGNLQRPNLSLGMAVHFEGLDPPTSKKVKSFIKRRLSELEI